MSTATLPYEFLWLNLQQRILNYSDNSKRQPKQYFGVNWRKKNILSSFVKQRSESLWILWPFFNTCRIHSFPVIALWDSRNSPWSQRKSDRTPVNEAWVIIICHHSRTGMRTWAQTSTLNARMTLTHRVQKLTINIVITLSILQDSSALSNNEILHALDKFSSGRPEASHQFSLCQWLKEKKKQTYPASNPFSENLKKLEVYCTFCPSKPTMKVESNKAKGRQC